MLRRSVLRRARAPRSSQHSGEDSTESDGGCGGKPITVPAQQAARRVPAKRRQQTHLRLRLGREVAGLAAAIAHRFNQRALLAADDELGTVSQIIVRTHKMYGTALKTIIADIHGLKCLHVLAIVDDECHRRRGRICPCDSSGTCATCFSSYDLCDARRVIGISLS
jgi:hypothetical protein